ncbi:uncharacterized protein LOC110116986 [Athalia rosae]|uniref:uncharacterized protein LOC110116986 n=1 Tax=Athalia rosae TaxID=37344 RepID=UPI0020335280|nr:uncharacterized protein LOC110116986 [Athalia rosae]
MKMLSLYTFCLVIFFLCGVLSDETLSKSTSENDLELRDSSSGLTGWIENGAMNLLDSFVPDDNPVEARKKKKKYNKYVLPLLVGFLLIKSILLPIALKSLAVLSGKAVILSLMSLILAAIVGLKKVAQGSSASNYDVVNIPLSKYRRNDDLYRRSGLEDDDLPYQFYRD